MTEYNHKLKAGLNSLGCSALSFSALAVPPLTSRKLSQQMVSQIIAGSKEFESSADAQEFLNVIRSMEHLQQTVEPRVPIDWSNVLELKQILATVHEQRKNDIDPVTVQHFYIRLSRLNFFKGMNSLGVVQTINPEKDGAAFSDLTLAQHIVQELKKIGVSGEIERLTGPRRRSTLTSSVEELGFKPDTEPVN